MPKLLAFIILLATGMEGSGMIAAHHSVGFGEEGIRYVRFSVTACRGGSSADCIQLSELQLIDGEGVVFVWPDGMSVSSELAGATCFLGPMLPQVVGRYVSGESPEALFDGSVNTKFCVYTAGTYPLSVTIDLGKPHPIGSGWSWRWYTANDAVTRDPVSFSLSGSSNGTTWQVLDDVVGATITRSRNALAYQGVIP